MVTTIRKEIQLECTERESIKLGFRCSIRICIFPVLLTFESRFIEFHMDAQRIYLTITTFNWTSCFSLFAPIHLMNTFFPLKLHPFSGLTFCILIVYRSLYRIFQKVCVFSLMLFTLKCKTPSLVLLCQISENYLQNNSNNFY